ncbi:Dual specificity protein phosphatase 26 [Anabarilius grahami]|uniref:Dual specificity protein phosphatase 26 n=1 Tax=Anabarilius grahami TaxID=495550 RepID=A0A3N0Z6E6_ANAGA|nr:Dual specificity protein phosphatase 26 [Anabarilius grahami]
MERRFYIAEAIIESSEEERDAILPMTSDEFMEEERDVTLHTSDGLMEEERDANLHTSDGLMEEERGATLHTSDGFMEEERDATLHKSDGFIEEERDATLHTSDGLMEEERDLEEEAESEEELFDQASETEDNTEFDPDYHSTDGEESEGEEEEEDEVPPEVVATYTCQRVTRRWPMVIFFNMLDVSAYNSFVLWMEINPTWQKTKPYRRRLFLEELGEALVTPYIKRRQHLPRTQSSQNMVKEAQACYSGAATPQPPPYSKVMEDYERSPRKKAPLSPVSTPSKRKREIASNRKELIKLGITHILNCAQSKWRGGAEHYAGMNITYHGIEAHDSPSFDMSVNFYPASEFIHRALSTGGTVLVHCAVGVSRSATLVLAYLMIRQNMTLVEAIKTVKDHRGVTPNRGFLRQLNGLDSVLRASRNAT